VLDFTGTRPSAFVIARLAVAVLLLLSATGSAAAQGDATNRGAYLAAAAGCDVCHTDTANNGAAYAGGRVMQSAFDMLVTPNLTPDRDTGLGRWSERDFMMAMRWGIAPDDSHYVPAFPFPYYGRLTDSDLADLWAYLGSLKAVRVPVRKQRGGLGLWPRARNAVALALAATPEAWRPDPARDAAWNRGAYLVATVGRCGDCHTPLTALGLPDRTRFLAGARAGHDGKPVPNITPDKSTGIGNWSEDDIVQVLTDGRTPSFDEVGGNMVEIVKNTARLTGDDRRAIAVFLQTVPAVSTPK